MYIGRKVCYLYIACTVWHSQSHREHSLACQPLFLLLHNCREVGSGDFCHLRTHGHCRKVGRANQIAQRLISRCVTLLNRERFDCLLSPGYPVLDPCNWPGASTFRVVQQNGGILACNVTCNVCSDGDEESTCEGSESDRLFEALTQAGGINHWTFVHRRDVFVSLPTGS